MEIVIDKELTVRQLAQIFSKKYPFLKIDVYNRGEEVSNDCFHTLHQISNMKDPQNFTILPEMSIGQIEQLFWDELGLQIAILRRVGHSWVNTPLTNDWTLERQNEITQHIFASMA
jgi:hypothetical protein